MSLINNDGMSEEEVGSRSTRAFATLGIRQVFITIINLITGIFLARIFSPAEFGILAVITLILGFISVFSDVGLAGSLLRQKNLPTERQYRLIFSIQQGLIFCLVGLIWFLSPWIVFEYKLPYEITWLFRLASLSLIFASLMVIPQIRLERNLTFGAIARVEIIQVIIYSSTAIGLGLADFGVWTFGWALLLRSIAGAYLVNRASPWRPGFAWNLKEIRGHLSFGLPY